MYLSLGLRTTTMTAHYLYKIRGSHLPLMSLYVHCLASTLCKLVTQAILNDLWRDWESETPWRAEPRLSFSFEKTVQDSSFHTLPEQRNLLASHEIHDRSSPSTALKVGNPSRHIAIASILNHERTIDRI
ncbi:hypothetical protein AXX17_AT1G32980 [Arabidopsis thaliana]|uniref:Uncharacterized protein n=1 Tax=Arabidopsis thaliana TaxID=3702 RepID=A0A178W1Y2_ARATH|nr:hypothetical protein AXX17_AT1G32980 [Arabidopsis thaliana]